MPTIYHLASKEEWDAAGATGEYRVPSLAEEGFIHCSLDIPQMSRVAARLYPGRSDLLVLDVDLDKLESPVKNEPSRSGEIYPHIYGTLNTTAVVRVRALSVDSDGGVSVEEQ